MPRRLVLFCLVPLLLTSCERKPGTTAQTESPSPTPKPSSTPSPTPVPTPTPEPTPYVPRKILQTGSLFNGINFKTHFETLTGSTATADREAPDSYTVEVTVKVKVPKPHQKLEELKKLNGQLDKLLPALPDLLSQAKVSPEFDNLYRTKTTQIRSSLDRLDQLLSRHNYYDCETILQLEHPVSKRHALLLQADMDVDTDGSDGDRIYSLAGNQSSTFQPFTSYRWSKLTKVPNPCLSIWEKRINENDAKAKDPKTSSGDAAKLKADNGRLRAELKELQAFSYLMGGADPFIVLPGQMFSRGKTGFTPAIGDYCVVIVNDVLYPAIVGDAGPIAKMGEASLRICREVSVKASPAYRPVADLKATYLVFPGSAERPMAPPNLDQWRTRCQELLTELGGYAGTLHQWENITKSAEPPPPPPPVPPATPPATPVTPPTVAPAGPQTPPVSEPAANGAEPVHGAAP